jgi:RNA polymerase sigma-70 factor (ECF subfamily)
MPELADREWVESVLVRYEQPLLRFASQLVGPAHAADVVQDTFLALCRASRAEVEPRLAAWLFVVCRNRALDLRRRDQRLSSLDDDSSVASPESGQASSLEQRQSMTRVQQIVDALPSKQRQALVLKFSAGMSYKQIAEVMELSVTHVGVILHHAIKHVRQQLEEDTPAGKRSTP